MRVALVVARAELLRFLRRKGTFWLFGSLAVVTVLAGLVGGSLSGAAAHDGSEPEAYGNVASVVVLVVLSAFGALEAGRSLAEEHDRGAWALLAQSPAEPSTLLVGKALGVVACVWVLNGFLQLLVVGTVPYVRMSHARALARLFLPAVFASFFVPEGLAYVKARGPGGSGREWLPLATLGRLAGFPLLIELVTMTSNRLAPGSGAAELIVAEASSLINLVPAPDFGVSRSALALGLVSWQVVSGLFILYRFVLHDER